MRRSDHDKLLREVLSDSALEQHRASSLAAGLRTMRGRRRRRAFLAGAAALLVVASGLAVLLPRRADPPRPAMAAASPPGPAPITVISDDQLLTLFANRPVALVGRAGARQELFFLDAPTGLAPRPQAD